MAEFTRFRSMAVPSNENLDFEEEKCQRSLCPIDVSETEDDLIGNLWVQEMLAGIRSQRAQWVAVLYILDELTMQDIADLLHLSREMVNQILNGYTQTYKGQVYEYPGVLAQLRARARATD